MGQASSFEGKECACWSGRSGCGGLAWHVGRDQMLINAPMRKSLCGLVALVGDCAYGLGMLKMAAFLIDGIHMDEDLILVLAILSMRRARSILVGAHGRTP